jgi:hypothetical protein
VQGLDEEVVAGLLIEQVGQRKVHGTASESFAGEAYCCSTRPTTSGEAPTTNLGP